MIGTVKWFNSTRGFGFINPDDGGEGVFVHISAVLQSPFGTLAEGQCIHYDLAKERGKVVAINLRRDGENTQPYVRDTVPLGVPLRGMVSWFGDKGFGFIAPHGGAKEIFVHISIVKAAGLREILAGDQVSFEAFLDPNGRIAVSKLAILDS